MSGGGIFIPGRHVYPWAQDAAAVSLSQAKDADAMFCLGKRCSDGISWQQHECPDTTFKLHNCSKNGISIIVHKIIRVADHFVVFSLCLDWNSHWATGTISKMAFHIVLYSCRHSFNIVYLYYIHGSSKYKYLFIVSHGHVRTAHVVAFEVNWLPLYLSYFIGFQVVIWSPL